MRERDGERERRGEVEKEIGVGGQEAALEGGRGREGEKSWGEMRGDTPGGGKAGQAGRDRDRGETEIKAGPREIGGWEGWPWVGETPGGQGGVGGAVGTLGTGREDRTTKG